MNYSVEFKELVENCVISNAHIGDGNPNAKILFVGQEAAYDGKTDEYNANIIKWKSNVNKLESNLYLEYENTFSSGHTWRKYQKLHNYIFPEFIAKEGRINFHERIFTTEMSDNPAKKNGEAKKNPNYKADLQKRKEFFFNEDFIQNFNVVVLACSGYLVNNEKNWEINNLFKVRYVGDEFGKKWYNKTNWFYIHYSEDNRKLVIHTRQLSNDVFDKMLEEMGKIIRNHIEKTILL